MYLCYNTFGSLYVGGKKSLALNAIKRIYLLAFLTANLHISALHLRELLSNCVPQALSLFSHSLSLSLNIPGCTNRWGVINRPPRRLCLIGLPRPSAMCFREMLTHLTVRPLTSPLSHFELLSRERSIYYEDSFGYEQIPDGFVGMKITKIKGKITVVVRPLIRCTKMLHSKSE